MQTGEVAVAPTTSTHKLVWVPLSTAAAMVGTPLELALPGAKVSGGGMATGTNLALAIQLELATGLDFNLTK